MSSLVPLFAVGLFTSFTLSQTGMVVHHRRLREPGWQTGLAINAAGRHRHGGRARGGAGVQVHLRRVGARRW